MPLLKQASKARQVEARIRLKSLREIGKNLSNHELILSESQQKVKSHYTSQRAEKNTVNIGIAPKLPSFFAGVRH